MKNYTLLLGLFLCITSCVNNISEGGGEEEESDVPVKFFATISQNFTRMTGTAFEEGDNIGLYALTPNGALDGSRYADNLPMVFQKGGSLSSQRPLFYPEGDVELEIFAYYPYRTKGIPAGSSLLPVAVKADQSSDEGFEASNFLTASANTVASDGGVELNFQHRTAKIAINLKASEGFSLDELEEANPRLVGINFYTEGEYNPADGSFSNLTGKRDIVAHGAWKKSEDGTRLTGKEFIVLPQNIGVLDRSISLEVNGRILTCTIAQEALEAGRGYSYEVGVDASGTGLVNITGTVGGWDETESKDAETTETGNAVHTSVFSFTGSNAYRAYYQGKAVAEVWREYLRNGTEAHQALVAYPMKDDEHCDLQNGLVLKFYDSEEAICGGKLSWNSNGTGYTYENGTREEIETFYVGADYKLYTENNGNAVEVSVSVYTLKDYRSATMAEYTVTKIGTQIWMAENLRATAYADGTALTQQEELGNVGYYQVEGTSVYFYNMETLQAGEMAPDGWRIATTADWEQLKTYIGNEVAVLKKGDWQTLGGSGTLAPVTNLAWFYAHPLGMWTGSHSSAYKLAAYWSWDTESNAPSNDLVILLGEETGFHTGVHAYDEKAGKYKAVAIRCVQK